MKVIAHERCLLSRSWDITRSDAVALKPLTFAPPVYFNAIPLADLQRRLGTVCTILVPRKEWEN